MCNLGVVNFALQKWDHAQAHYNAALSLARSLHDRRSEGLFLGYLGQLQARQGRFDEARTSVDAGEQLLLQLADPISLGLIRCHRVELELRAGDRTAALVSLAQARHIAEQLGSGPASELGLALARVSSMLRGEDGSDA
jgi:tetratricopeptide (TPR) repeat protein